MNLPSSWTYARVLAIVRILTGVIWLIHGVPKFLRATAFLPPSGFFATYLQQGIVKTTGPYHDFLVNTVSPNAALFAELVRFGEVCVGLALFLGLLSRLGGFFGIVLTLNYIFARGGQGSLSEWGSIDGCLLLLSAMSFVLPTGRVAGFGALTLRRAQRREHVVGEVVPERPLDGPTASR